MSNNITLSNLQNERNTQIHTHNVVLWKRIFLKAKKRESTLPSPGLLSKRSQWPGQAWPKPKVNMDLQHGWQRFNYLSHYHCLAEYALGKNALADKYSEGKGGFSSAGSFPKYFQHLGLGKSKLRAWNLIQGSPAGGRDPLTGAIICCLPESVNRKLKLEQSQDLNPGTLLWADTEWHHNHCTECLALFHTFKK